MLVLSGGRNVKSTWFMFGSNMNRITIGKMLRSQRDWIASFMIGMAAKPNQDIVQEMYFLECSRHSQSGKRSLALLGGVKSLANAEQAMDEGFECVVLARALLHGGTELNKFQSGRTGNLRLR